MWGKYSWISTMSLKSQQAATSRLEADAMPFKAALKEGFAIGIEMKELESGPLQITTS